MEIASEDKKQKRWHESQRYEEKFRV